MNALFTSAAVSGGDCHTMTKHITRERRQNIIKLNQIDAFTEFIEVGILEGLNGLYIHDRLNRATVPEGFYCYEVADISGFDNPEVLAEHIPDHLFYGSVLTRRPVELDELGQRRIGMGYYESEYGNPIVWTLREYMKKYFPDEPFHIPAPEGAVKEPHTSAPEPPQTGLPAHCYVLQDDGTIGLVDRGRRGCRPYPFCFPYSTSPCREDNADMVYCLNAALGIGGSEAERMKKLALSMRPARGKPYGEPER